MNQMNNTMNNEKMSVAWIDVTIPMAVVVTGMGNRLPKHHIIREVQKGNAIDDVTDSTLEERVERALEVGNFTISQMDSPMAV